MASLHTLTPPEHTPIAPGECPLCHNVQTSVSAEWLQAGGTWRCATCDQVWSARRLDTVAAYAQYVSAH
jgi:predicted CXXCH cytochrome family protein